MSLTTITIISASVGIAIFLYLVIATYRSGNRVPFKPRPFWKSPRVQNPPPPPPLPEKKQEPELSCFVKGLIKSMETEPEAWEECETAMSLGAFADRRCHNKTSIYVCYSPCYHPDDKGDRVASQRPYAWLESYSLPDHERWELGKAYYAAFIEPAERKEREEYQRKTNEILSYFEPLGCPSKKSQP